MASIVVPNTHFVDYYRLIFRNVGNRFNRDKMNSGQYQVHHIVPQSMRDKDEPWIHEKLITVMLHRRDHYKAHVILNRALKKKLPVSWIKTMAEMTDEEYSAMTEARRQAIKDRWVKCAIGHRLMTRTGLRRLRRRSSERMTIRAANGTHPRMGSRRCCCIYCRQEMSILMLARWHGEKCKNKDVQTDSSVL